jgi:hypothetical protein
MRENIPEIPGTKKPEAGKQDNSIFLEAYQREKKIIEELDNQILERVKFLERQTDPEIRRPIEAEISDLRKKKLEARAQANMAINDHRWSDEEMEKNISPLMH